MLPVVAARTASCGLTPDAIASTYALVAAWLLADGVPTVIGLL